MARITHAEIVGIRMAQEGSGGYTVNSTSYSVLVFYNDGTVNLVEGSAKEIRPYLPYMRPHGDLYQLKQILDQVEARLEASIEKTVKTSINDILYESRNPLPKGLTGKSGHEAKTILEEAGFKVEFFPMAPAEANGIVLECLRKESDRMTVVLEMKYVIPNVIGLNEDLAVEKLRSAGFNPTVIKTKSEGIKENSVIRIKQSNDSMDVDVFVCVNTESEKDIFIKAINGTNSLKEILLIWNGAGLGALYPEINKYIERKVEFEKFYGKLKDIDKEKAKLIELLNTADT